MIFSYLLMLLLTISALGRNCDDILCSNVFDEVCGMFDGDDGAPILMAFKNICFMSKEACMMSNILGNEIPKEIQRVADELCDINRPDYETLDSESLGETRRVIDFSIVGSPQVCNHSCPTFCTDAYDPACAQVWSDGMGYSWFRTMVNHCHIDLYSCVSGLNVTIIPLEKCLMNPLIHTFTKQIAGLKALKLIDKIKLPSNSRRTNIEEEDQNSLNKFLLDLTASTFKVVSDGHVEPHD